MYCSKCLLELTKHDMYYYINCLIELRLTCKRELAEVMTGSKTRNMLVDVSFLALACMVRHRLV